VPTRIAAALATGPAAFLLGGILDVMVYALESMRGRTGSGRGR
jgi:hypothetical protein